MPDFSALLSKPAGEAKKPIPLPVATYPGVVKKWEVLPPPIGKDYTAIFRFHLGITGWPANVTEDEKMQDLGSGLVPIDLSKKQLRRDFYDSALVRLDDFIRSCGVEPKGRTYGEILPELIGKNVNMDVKQYLNQTTNELGNTVDQVAGTDN